MGYQCSFAERMVSRTGLPRDEPRKAQNTKCDSMLVDLVQQVAAGSRNHTLGRSSWLRLSSRAGNPQR